jgi:hypothetical protein
LARGGRAKRLVFLAQRHGDRAIQIVVRVDHGEAGAYRLIARSLAVGVPDPVTVPHVGQENWIRAGVITKSGLPYQVRATVPPRQRRSLKLSERA